MEHAILSDPSIRATSVDHVFVPFCCFPCYSPQSVSFGHSGVCLFTISMSTSMFSGIILLRCTICFSSSFHVCFSSSFLFIISPFLSHIIHTPPHPPPTSNTSVMATERPAMLISTHSPGPSDGPDCTATPSPVRLNSFDSRLGCPPFSSSLYSQHGLSGRKRKRRRGWLCWLYFLSHEPVLSE